MRLDLEVNGDYMRLFIRILSFCLLAIADVTCRAYTWQREYTRQRGGADSCIARLFFRGTRR